MRGIRASAIAGFASAVMVAPAFAQITLFEQPSFEGRSFGVERQVDDLSRSGFNDRAASAVVTGQRWEVCEHANFGGRCVVLPPGSYTSLAQVGLDRRVSSARPARGDPPVDERQPVVALITLYEGDRFSGRSFTTGQDIDDLRRDGFNDRASSAVVSAGQWQVCEAAGFQGHCTLLAPGQYASLSAKGLNNNLSSMRLVDSPNNAVSAGRVTFYEHVDFRGRTLSTQGALADLGREGFGQMASSVIVEAGDWQVCDGAGYVGRCVVLPPGRYASLGAAGLNDRVSSVRPNDTTAPAAAELAEVTFYEHDDFAGRSLSTQTDLADFSSKDFNDRASSVIVSAGDWEVCDDAGFSGQCKVLHPGRYASLRTLGLNDRVSSVRQVGTVADYRRRGNEPLFQANVLAVRAVMGTPEQRCWMEREKVADERSGMNVPAAIAGAVIGGILGHQVGGGRGKDLATAGGAVAGAVAGSTIGRNGGKPQTQEVQRCSDVNTGQAKPEYWDVTYVFQGQEHRVQMASPPGASITVNAQGEPRI
ncbi:MAG: peptidase inhibitor family I36 protein [Burkholderiaceae bacterium]|nr:peptidase inhibitor family I36 protein [Burkholderiaceae bacterium]